MLIILVRLKHNTLENNPIDWNLIILSYMHNLVLFRKMNQIDENKGLDFLHIVMSDEYADGEGCFNFMVQLQDPNQYMPIEATGIECCETDSPLMPLAKVRIPSQAFNSPEQYDFYESLSFPTWNSLNEQRAIGELNRVRKEGYQASPDYRYKKIRRRYRQTWIGNVIFTACQEIHLCSI